MFRKLLPSDADQLRRHLLALSPAERRMRFHGAVSEAAIERRCRRIDWFRTVAVGWWLAGRLRGVGEVHFDRSLMPHEAEVAVTVETPWQGRGIGTELTRRALMVARNRGAARVTMLCLVENAPMRRIARKLAGAEHAALRHDGASVAADLGLRRASPLSLLEELLQDGTGGWSAVTDRLLA
ncbi:MAG: GNAT family N-acetyltransferase [Alphaproteobacteria bacterium]|nr:GNAT family N-acetyltransferase [Alphaproteobacteria bacterium]